MNGTLEVQNLPSSAPNVKAFTGIKKRNGKNVQLSYERARELFDYDPETGDLTWRVSTNWSIKVGSRAGGKDAEGYMSVGVDRISYKVHRIIWLWVHGYIPENEIDHINRVRDDNRLCNLREASRSCNMRNFPVREDNTSGVPGVCWDKSRDNWIASVFTEGKCHYIKASKDFTEAVAHRLAAEQCLNWAGCDSNSSAYQYMRDYLTTASQ
jgi:hypothetical protein